MINYIFVKLIVEIQKSHKKLVKCKTRRNKIIISLVVIGLSARDCWAFALMILAWLNSGEPCGSCMDEDLSTKPLSIVLLSEVGFG